MKKSLMMLMSVSVLTVNALAQAPSPAPAPEGAPPPQVRGPRTTRPTPGAQRGSGLMETQMGMDRLVGAIAQGQEMSKKLNLTPEQQEQIKTMVMEQRTKMIDQHAALQKAALKQAEVLMADPLDEKALMEAVEETSKVRTEIAKQQIQILIDVRNMMTEEQRKTLRELMVQMKQQPMRRPGEGGMREGLRGREGGPREGGVRERTRDPQAPRPAEKAPAPAQ